MPCWLPCRDGRQGGGWSRRSALCLWSFPARLEPRRGLLLGELRPRLGPAPGTPVTFLWDLPGSLCLNVHPLPHPRHFLAPFLP